MTRQRGSVRRLPATILLVAGTLAALSFGSWPRQVLAISLLPQPDAYSVIHDRTLVVPPPGVLGNDLGLLGGETAVYESGPSNGVLSLRPDGGFTYTPAGGYVGTDIFRYHPSGLLVISTKVTITITNAAPVAVNDSYNAVTGVTLSVPAPGVLANDGDADGDALSASLVDDGGNGSLDLNADGSFTFKSGGSFTGLRTFTYEATDGLASSSTRTVSINVSAPAPTPTPTPPPTPAPTPSPTPAPTPTPLPTLPLPTLPLPTLPPPTLPLPTLPLPSVSIAPLPGGSSTPTPTIGPGGSPGASPTATPSSSNSASASPGTSTLPGASTDPSATPGPGSDPSAPAGGPGSGGGVPPGGDRGFTVGFSGFGPIDGLVDVDIVGFDALLVWAVPALVLSVPGLLLLLAVLAQAAGGLFWLPMVRRWLGGVGVRRRRSAEGEAH